MIALFLSLFLSLFTSFTSADLPIVQVQTGEPEAIWVPAGSIGPLVAAPFDESAFEVIGG